MSDTPFSDSTSSTADVVTAVDFTGTTLTLTKQAGDDLTTTISSSPQVVTGLTYNAENDDKLKLTQSAGTPSFEVTIPSGGGGSDPIYGFLHYSGASGRPTGYTIDFNTSMMQRQSAYGDGTFVVTTSGGSDAPTLATQSDNLTSGLKINKDGLYRVYIGFTMTVPNTQNTSLTVSVKPYTSVNGSFIGLVDRLPSNLQNRLTQDYRGYRDGSFTTYLKLEENNFVWANVIYRNASTALNTCRVSYFSYLGVERVSDLPT